MAPARLVADARCRLPHCAERLWVGTALDWTSPDGRRFDFVHALLDLAGRLAQMIHHRLDHLVAPGACW